MLDILIASITERDFELQKLLIEFRRQGANPIVLTDNKEMTIGEKRQRLLEMATKDWVVFFDDDDWPNQRYIEIIHEAIQSDPEADCCGIWGTMTVDGNLKNIKTWCHRLGYEVVNHRSKGFDYLRPIIHFNPVRRDKALKAGFDKSMRFGEDMDFGKRLQPYLTKEVFIRTPLFLYRYSTKKQHNEKYGIK